MIPFHLIQSHSISSNSWFPRQRLDPFCLALSIFPFILDTLSLSHCLPVSLRMFVDLRLSFFVFVSLSVFFCLSPSAYFVRQSVFAYLLVWFGQPLSVLAYFSVPGYHCLAVCLSSFISVSVCLYAGYVFLYFRLCMSLSLRFSVCVSLRYNA